MRAVIFDLDGTLCDSAPDLRAAANKLLQSIGHKPLSLEVVKSFIGNGVPKLVERIMVHSEIELTMSRHIELYAEFERIYGANPVERTVLYPGVRDALDMLQRRGYAMGICTNKAHKITLMVLEGLKIDHFSMRLLVATVFQPINRIPRCCTNASCNYDQLMFGT